MNEEVKVHEDGLVRLLDIMGSDDDVVDAARISYGKGTKKVSETRNLIRYLMRHKHTSPFEMCEVKFYLKLPIFVMRQIVRHRTANLNEYSGRYSLMSEDFYVPHDDDIQKQSTQNNQGRGEDIEQKGLVKFEFNRIYDNAIHSYHNLLDLDLARELANRQVQKLNEREQDDEHGGFIRRRDPREDFGTNPCSEIILRSREFCNLSEVVVRGRDTRQSLKDKVRNATILGTFQSTLINFKYITKEWARNCEEERLLGVSLTGIMDNELTNGKKGKEKTGKLLEELRNVAIETNKEWSTKLGIPRSAAITCIKPSGTVSQLVDSSSGIHARHNPYYIRTVRADNKDPLCKFMKDAKFPNEPDITKPTHTAVFSFPQKSPKGAICRTDMTAIDQLELWKIYQDHWCEHKPSITVSVKEHEWMVVGSWVWENFDSISGISFLPFSEHTYKQAPYQDCDEEQYKELLLKMPKNVNWDKLSDYEKEDHTAGAQTQACGSDGGCEVVDLI